MQPNVWYDPELGKWRCWYSTFTSCSKPKHLVPECDNAPQKCGTMHPKGFWGGFSGIKFGRAFAYAESSDGYNWSKPPLGLVSWNGSTANNLLRIGGMASGVHLDESAPPSQRYKLVTLTADDESGGVVASPDGVHVPWNATKDLSYIHGRWDTPMNAFYDAANSRWIMMLRSTPTERDPSGGLRIQSFSRSLSRDFLGKWSAATPTGLDTAVDWQPDGLVAWPYEGIFIGVGNVFNPQTKRAANGAAIGQTDMVLGWSADGTRWKWLLNDAESSMVPLGAAGDFDSCGVFGAVQDPLRTVANDTMRLYYTGKTTASALSCGRARVCFD